MRRIFDRVFRGACFKGKGRGKVVQVGQSFMAGCERGHSFELTEVHVRVLLIGRRQILGSRRYRRPRRTFGHTGLRW